MFQKAILKAQSKASMGGNRAKMSPLLGKLAEIDLSRKLEFRRLGLQKQQQDLANAGRDYYMKLAEDELETEEKNLPMSALIGLGSAGLSALEGRRRANETKELTEDRKETNKLLRDAAESTKIQRWEAGYQTHRPRFPKYQRR